jgi:hypothetical protein
MSRRAHAKPGSLMNEAQVNTGSRASIDADQAEGLSGLNS